MSQALGALTVSAYTLLCEILKWAGSAYAPPK